MSSRNDNKLDNDNNDDDIGRWSDGRVHIKDLDNDMKDIIKCKDNLDTINSVLLFLSKDDNLHDDLKLPIVNIAINHWTIPDKRLPPEKAKRLQEDRSVLYVLEKIQLLQHVMLLLFMTITTIIITSRYVNKQAYKCL